MTQPIMLRDDATGSTVKVHPQLGFNCYSFRPVVDGVAHEALWSDPEFEGGQCRPSRSGIPVLFPFAGRIGGTVLEFEGQRYPLKMRDPQGKNAIHGLALDQPWEVLETTPNRIVGRFVWQRDENAAPAVWPASCELRVTYQLRGATLESTFDVFNPDTRDLPFWLGAHGYFRVPLGEKGNRDDCRVFVPAAKYWELADLLPTGKTLDATGDRDLRRGPTFGELSLDDAFTELSSSDGWVRARIEDAANRRALRVDFSDNFLHCVVFQPPHREAICIEPYTAVPDAFRLEQAGVATGLRMLAPGESFHASIHMTLEALA